MMMMMMMMMLMMAKVMVMVILIHSLDVRPKLSDKRFLLLKGHHKDSTVRSGAQNKRREAATP
jgi:hypothetical protein